ncbi:MAG: D-ribose pyranase [Anaerovibrio sp.]|uniref:D-ribose pyranase n=1 Tax=Anaerovibrio sp. TaxID=1872532 RepID=UPI0025F37F7C|nr:D-ribose pyranase [Anaerovibrio sp.]MCR5175593.1 D-ribose pyranase [Anaerovibrio sp.]
MKKTGILNADLSYLVATLGHKDLVMVGDAGMPIPEGVAIVDLALSPGVPTFRQALDALLSEMEVEYYYLADEMKEKNPDLMKYVIEKLEGLDMETMSHDNLKKMSSRVKFAVRTGEFSPYANVILRSGVVF